jgi:hypothetical protein
MARTASQCGDIFATGALSLLVFDLTGSATGVSAVIVAELLPVLLLAPLAGSRATHLRRRQPVHRSRWSPGGDHPAQQGHARR